TKSVELPEDLRRTLAEQSLVRAFERCSFSQRREWVVGILEAKREKTRINRIKQVVDDLTSN
ncbi:MAG: YdeI/OmpD-associated family protein, partial [Bacteroidota bacterium]